MSGYTTRHKTIIIKDIELKPESIRIPYQLGLPQVHALASMVSNLTFETEIRDFQEPQMRPRHAPRRFIFWRRFLLAWHFSWAAKGYAPLSYARC